MSVRIPNYGNTHNLVGKPWFSGKITDIDRNRQNEGIRFGHGPESDRCLNNMGSEAMKRSTLPAVLVVAMLTVPSAQAAGVTDEDILNDARATTAIVSYGMGPHQHRFSPLDQINTSNIGKLVPAWSFSFGGEKQRGQETQPLVYEGKIFVTGSYSRMWAVDAATGHKIWEYNHRLPEGILPCCDVINRGAALYGELAIFGTLDGQLVALNQNTGKVVWRETLGDYSAGVSITHAPIIVRGKVLVAIAGSEFGVAGKVEARDALTGKLIWSRPTIEGEMGTLNGQDNGITGTLNATWPGDTWKTGGGAAWNGGTWDPELNLSYRGVGNAAPWNPAYRRGDNLYANSTIAIDNDTGKIVWHYQHVPNDTWDYDSVSELCLST